MKKLHVSLVYYVVGDTSIMVPDNLTIEEAINYAKDHIKDIELPSNPEYIYGSDYIDEDDCDFED